MFLAGIVIAENILIN